MTHSARLVRVRVRVRVRVLAQVAGDPLGSPLVELDRDVAEAVAPLARELEGLVRVGVRV